MFKINLSEPAKSKLKTAGSWALTASLGTIALLTSLPSQDDPVGSVARPQSPDTGSEVYRENFQYINGRPSPWLLPNEGSAVPAEVTIAPDVVKEKVAVNLSFQTSKNLPLCRSIAYGVQDTNGSIYVLNWKSRETNTPLTNVSFHLPASFDVKSAAAAISRYGDLYITCSAEIKLNNSPK